MTRQTSILHPLTLMMSGLDLPNPLSCKMARNLHLPCWITIIAARFRRASSTAVTQLASMMSTHVGNSANPHKVTAQQIGAVPFVNAESAEFNMDTILSKAHSLTVYECDGNTLGTPLKAGVTNLVACTILSYANSNSNGMQLALMNGGAPFYRYRDNGTVSSWKAITLGE